MLNVQFVDDVLTDLRYRPTDTRLYEQLVNEYEQSDAQGRAYIRGTLVHMDDVILHIAAWKPARVADSPQRFIKLRLTILSMIDGYPSSCNALEELHDLWQIAERYHIDPLPLFWRVAALSSGIRRVSVRYLIEQVIEENHERVARE